MQEGNSQVFYGSTAESEQSMGLRLRMLMGTDFVTKRFGPSLGEIWQGFTKNECKACRNRLEFKKDDGEVEERTSPTILLSFSQITNQFFNFEFLRSD